MCNLAIYGAGGFGREVALMIRQINQHHPAWELKGFYDDGKSPGELVDGLSVIGGQKQLMDLNEEISIVVAIADSATRKKIVSSIARSNISFPVIIHPQAMPGDIERNKFGKGSIITAGCILTTSVILEEFVIINLSCTVGHDVTLGAYTSVMPGCSLSGSVKVGEEVLIGTGARILPQLTLGTRCRVGAGAVVTHDVPPDTTVIGVPAKPMKHD
ncbi:MAG TPA: acetyltransferase [Ohtaekwangia sp.]|nr:acetyltransferase [Ohtaekwangia sp.]